MDVERRCPSRRCRCQQRRRPCCSQRRQTAVALPSRCTVVQRLRIAVLARARVRLLDGQRCSSLLTRSAAPACRSRSTRSAAHRRCGCADLVDDVVTGGDVAVLGQLRVRGQHVLDVPCRRAPSRCSGRSHRRSARGEAADVRAWSVTSRAGAHRRAVPTQWRSARRRSSARRVDVRRRSHQQRSRRPTGLGRTHVVAHQVRVDAERRVAVTVVVRDGNVAEVARTVGTDLQRRRVRAGQETLIVAMSPSRRPGGPVREGRAFSSAADVTIGGGSLGRRRHTGREVRPSTV